MDTQQNVKTEKVTNKRSIKRDYFYAVGRQKEAVARVRLYATVKDDAKWGEHAIKKQQILVNAEPIERYFPGPLAKAQRHGGYKSLGGGNGRSVIRAIQVDRVFEVARRCRDRSAG